MSLYSHLHLYFYFLALSQEEVCVRNHPIRKFIYLGKSLFFNLKYLTRLPAYGYLFIHSKSTVQTLQKTFLPGIFSCREPIKTWKVYLLIFSLTLLWSSHLRQLNESVTLGTTFDKFPSFFIVQSRQHSQKCHMIIFISYSSSLCSLITSMQ